MTRPELSLRARLRLRALAYARIRDFFATRGVLEVQTPTLGAGAVTDPALASLAVDVSVLAGRRYLRTSPEFAHKRLLAAGSGDIYELGRVYRDGELGRWHQPEFELLEWYREGCNDFALMDEVFELLCAVLAPAFPVLGRQLLPYADAFAACLGVDVHALDRRGSTELRRSLSARGIEVPAGTSGDALLDLALATAIVPGWPAGTVVFLHGYPVTQAALARIRPGSPPVAARFEVFLNGIELGNGFHELADAAEQRARFTRDLACRRERGLPELPVDADFLAALDDGLPDCAGVALGVDRLIALVAGADSIAPVITHPHNNLVSDT
jgi:lysyl-tRNA synthetase class 2